MFNIAYASNGYQGSGLAGFIPMLIMFIIIGLVLRSIATRKGKNKWLWFFIGFVPGVNLLCGLWLASLPDVSLLGEIDAITSELRKQGLMPRDEEKGAA